MTHLALCIAWGPTQLAADTTLFHVASHVGAYMLAALMLAAAVARAIRQARQRHWPAALAWLVFGTAAAALTFTAFTIGPDYPQPMPPVIDSSQFS